jgi:hypothetical protein
MDKYFWINLGCVPKLVTIMVAAIGAWRSWRCWWLVMHLYSCGVHGGGADPTPYAVLEHETPSRSNHTLIFHDPQTIIFLPQTDERARECRAQRQGMKMHSIMGIIALALCSVLFLNSIQPSVPDVVDHDFGVAFDLTSPYG